MTNPIYLRAWGNLACFTRPEMKVERVSYPVITPSAARGLLEAILYKPQFRWRIHRIAIRRPIQFLAFRRNEVKSKASRNPEPIFADEDRTQRNTLALRDVDYVIEASLDLTPLAGRPRLNPHGADEPTGDDNLGKYYGMARRRIEQGQCFHQPDFGCREFLAHFELASASAMQVLIGLNADADLGLMLYDVFDLDISDCWQTGKVEARPQITFFRASLKNGIVEIPAWSEVRKQLGGAT
ncbi:MAG: type I-C CRISPR-associated protein Cas5c [Opitutaceae bacterium]|jgi:CRISPR-associated protein Cas5d